MARTRQPAPMSTDPAPPPQVPSVARARRRTCSVDGCGRGCWDTSDLCRIHLNEHLAGMFVSDEQVAALTSQTSTDPATAGEPKE